MNILKSVWLKIGAGLVILLTLLRFKDKFEQLKSTETLNKNKELESDLKTSEAINNERLNVAKELLSEKQIDAERSSHEVVEDFYKEKLK